jgi:hypothetical protein
VRAWLDGLLDSVWELTQAKQAWGLVRESQEMEYGQELARARQEQAKKDKMEKLDKIKKYLDKRRLEAHMEAVRGGCQY